MSLSLSIEYEAIRQDVHNLFTRFNEFQSVRFEDFCTAWKSMNFSCILYSTYQNNNYAHMRLVERLFRATSEYLSPDSNFLHRVTAMYTLYAVFFKQISDRKVYIRMTPKMWKDMIELQRSVIEHQHLDVAYVIQKLRSHKAFIFVAFPKHLMFGRNEFMLGVESLMGNNHTSALDQYIDSLSSSSFLQQVTDIESEYEEVKQKLLNESKESEKPLLSKVLFYSSVGFSDEFKKLISDPSENKEDNWTGNLESSQRPTVLPLNELPTEDVQLKSELSEESKRAKAIRQIKEKSWKLSACEGDNESEEENDQDVYYKKSAMLTPYEKIPLKRINTGLRFKKNVLEK